MCWTNAIIILRVSWKTFSTFQCGLILLRIAAIRLCSRTQTKWFNARFGISWTLLSPIINWKKKYIAIKRCGNSVTCIATYLHMDTAKHKTNLEFQLWYQQFVIIVLLFWWSGILFFAFVLLFLILLFSLNSYISKLIRLNRRCPTLYVLTSSMMHESVICRPISV